VTPWHPPEPGPAGWVDLLAGKDPRPLAALRLLSDLTLAAAAPLLGYQGPSAPGSVSKPELRGLAVAIEVLVARARAYGWELRVEARKIDRAPGESP
jgi:hypothetical protein